MPPNPGPQPLTDAERETLLLLLDGMANKAVAARIGVSERTVERLRSRALRKLGVATLVQAARLGFGSRPDADTGPHDTPSTAVEAPPWISPWSAPPDPLTPEWYAVAFRASASGFLAIDRDCRILAANEAFCRLVGRPESELLGMNVAALTHPDDVARDAARNQAFFAGEFEWFRSDKRYTRPEGAVVPAHLVGGLVRDPNGTALFGVGTVVPI